MKVILINGSPHQNGTTARALKELTAELNNCGIETETVPMAGKVIRGCIGCYYCRKNGKCVFNDEVNEVAQKIKSADGLIIATPVYYASVSGTLKCFLDRLFCSAGSGFAFKPAAAVAVARRAGTVSAFDEINKYFSICNMPIVSSSYWNNVFGANGEDAERDGEGLQTMRNLAKNTAWLISCINAGKAAGINPPSPEKTSRTNFIK